MRKWISGAAVIGTFAVLCYLENRRPLRKKSVEPKLTNAARNLAIASLAGITINFLEKPLAVRLTKTVENQKIGLLKIIPLPRFVETACAVILLDYTLYLWHTLTHKLPFLWRFHRIHHADLDLTVSTAVRFHFAEMAVSVPFRAGQILLIGVSPQALQLWQTLLFISIFFHHSNVRLPKWLEAKLEYFIATPRLHGIHHSRQENERDSNWSSGLTLWDFLHKTFRNDVSPGKIKIGVEGFDSIDEVSLGRMLSEPFVLMLASEQKALQGLTD